MIVTLDQETLAARPLVVIGTPVYGTLESASVAVGYHMAVCGLMRNPAFDVMLAVCGLDIVRARSRLIRQFLETTEATHLLFWDSDITTSADQAGRLVNHLLASGHDYVGCTYPMKRVRWDKVATQFEPGKHPETYAYEYPIQLSQDRHLNGFCLPVEGIPLGFALCSRTMLQTMVDHYGKDPEFTYDDIVAGTSTPTVAVCKLALVDRKLLGEDYSLAHWWRKIGGEVMLYIGPDCELGHVGSMLFQGRRDGFVK